MKALAAAWTKLETRIDAMVARERVILAATSILVLLFVWYQAFAVPSLQKIKLQEEQARSMTQQWEALSQQLGPLEQRLADDPNKVLVEQGRQLNLQIEQLDRSLQERLERLVKPEEMAVLLEKLLHQNPGLQVVRIEKLPAIPVMEAAAGNDKAAPSLYRHGLRMVFEGGYFDTLNYLKRLEGMDKAILFNSFEYEVLEYPGSRVTLEVETLSLDKGWMGV